MLDRELVALSGVDARCRLIRARIVAEFLARRAWRALGFVRLGDFARERLGVSPRSLEEDARVVRALDRLTSMRASLESGQLAWTRARLLVRVATPANEARLLGESAGVAYRDLEAWVRALAARTDECHASGEAARHETPPPEAPAADASPTALDDPIVRWSIEVSRSGRRIWRAACEYASRTAGSPLSPSQVLELVAAEASAAVPQPAVARWTPSPEEHERRLRAGVRAREERGRRFLFGFLAETGVAEGFPWLDPSARDPGPAAALQPLQHDLQHADGFELERRLQVLRGVTQRTDAQMAALLRTGIDRRLFQEIGFASVKLYVESRLGLSARTAWGLVAIERESWRQSRMLNEAWKDGRLSRLQALALLPVLRTRNAEAWIRRASEVTLRRLQDEVAWALDQGEPRGSVDENMPPGPEEDIRQDSAADVTLAEVQNRAHGEPTDSSLGPAGAVRLDFCAPVSVLVLVESTLDGLARAREARWQTFERMVALALLEWMTAPRHRDPVFERDGWRCAVPACTSRRNLHDHHVVFRSEGGTDACHNRVTVCAAHHLHGIHAGVVRAEGLAPDGIRWELGCAPERDPHLRLHGDRYV